MSGLDPNLHVVRPFGLIGGKYEVDTAGLRKYQLSLLITAAFFGLLLFRRAIGAPIWLIAGAFVLVLIFSIALNVQVVRGGRKI